LKLNFNFARVRAQNGGAISRKEGFPEMKSLKGEGLDLSHSITPLLRKDLIYFPSAASRNQNLRKSKALIMALPTDHAQDYCIKLVDREYLEYIFVQISAIVADLKTR